MRSMTALTALHRPVEYPRSSGYDAAWLLGLDMGPNPLWLLEDLVEPLGLRPGMRVLDLGSGRGASSVFLAREFGVEVFAVDLWVTPAEVGRVVREAGVADLVHPLQAEAHALPFAPEHFDAIVSIDAYEYFGTADGYLAYLSSFLKPHGSLAIATPAMRREVRDMGGIPAHIKACVGWEALAWHTPEWWRFQWEVTDLVTVTSAALQPQGWRNWLLWSRAVREVAPGPSIEAVLEMLEADNADLLSFALVTARKEGRSPPHPVSDG